MNSSLNIGFLDAFLTQRTLSFLGEYSEALGPIGKHNIPECQTCENPWGHKGSALGVRVQKVHDVSWSPASSIGEHQHFKMNTKFNRKTV